MSLTFLNDGTAVAYMNNDLKLVPESEATILKIVFPDGRRVFVVPQKKPLIAFDPSQPRDPAGTSTGGQWTSGGGGTATLERPAGKPKSGDVRARIREIVGEAPQGGGAHIDTLALLKKYDIPNDQIIEYRTWGDLQNEQPVTVDPNNIEASNTPERLAIREKIVSDYMRDHPAATKGHEAFIIIGSPGAGKNTAIGDELMATRGAMLVDNDAVKEYFPEYKGGIGTQAVHFESSELVFPKVLDAATAQGNNFVWTRIGKSAEPLAQEIQNLKGKGYKVHLYLVDIPTDESAKRAFKRWHNAFVKSGGKAARLVSLSFVKSVGGHPKTTFKRLGRMKIADSYHVYDNNVPFGTKAKHVRTWAMRG